MKSLEKYLFLMAYDESWDGDTTPGPVASFPWVEKSIQVLLAEGVSPQKIMLWGKSDATDEEIERAVKISCADEFISGTISENTKGYDTLLGQGGVNLSGGQKQRLSLARAIIRNPRILVLDDCTSALDAATESKVLRGIREEIKGATVLLISQRISTVIKADRILCIDNGRVQGFGSHTELLAKCPTYKAIYNSQIGGEGNGR